MPDRGAGFALPRRGGTVPVMRRVIILFAVLALLAAACSGTAEDTTTTSLVPVTTTDPGPPNEFGYVADFLMGLRDVMGLSGIGFVPDRTRVTPSMEGAYVNQMRQAPLTEGLPDDLTRFSDDQILFLGYLYCVALDGGGTAADAVGLVAGSVAASRGLAPEAAETEDIATAVAAANYAGGSICGQYNEVTQAFIDTLRGG
jgi:hypothetical protein